MRIETIGNATLHQGDCLALMEQLPDASVDMILCDLPYGTTACKWDTVIPFEPLWAQYRRIAKKNAAIVLTASQPFTSALVMSNPGMFKYEWIWEKSKASNFVKAKSMALKAHESVLVFGLGKLPYFPQMTVGEPFKGAGRSLKGSESAILPNVPNPTFRHDNAGTRYPRSVQYFATAESEKTGALHPTQKPVALMEYLIRTYTEKGGVVMDNCMGSGTTGVACANTGRKFIGIELDETYFNTACRRLALRF